MKHTRTTSSFALLFSLMLVACGEAGDDAYDSDDDLTTETDPVRGSDGGAERDARADASPSDAARARADASSGEAEDASRTRDAAARDATASDAATQTNDAATSTGTDVPSGEHCAPVSAWDAQAAQFEQEVLTLTNAARAQGHNCDTEGNFGPAGPLKMEPRLRCSARLHSKYMADTSEFAHTEMATGADPFKRMTEAGYTFRTAGENIAAGQSTPKQVVDGWLESDGHCANIMNPKYTDLGVGYAQSPGSGRGRMPYWTQNFAQPR